MELYSEQQLLPISKPDLLIYPRRKLLILTTMGTTLSSLFYGGLAIYWYVSLHSIEFSWFLAILSLCMFCLCCPFWRTLLSHQPALLITNEGIQLYGIQRSLDRFIQWSEIDAISLFFYLGRPYFGILPKNPAYYQARFTAWQRFWVDLSSFTGLPPISVGMLYLDMSVADLFQQITHRFASELRENHIRLLPITFKPT